MAVASNGRDRNWRICLSPFTEQKFYDSIRDRCFKRITENIPITQTIRYKLFSQFRFLYFKTKSSELGKLAM
ncbi:predicted protein [Arabidopsis lyrata subsp. lyrata]|uniref:Predicted protein n=1 Tax=Arabidopsis lyrata subsp. lyrata TaxID=81972 RepID=D7KDY8_ARALL|nr:predicted protein [Arabidopsis lyrata subsp. lyrata]